MKFDPQKKYPIEDKHKKIADEVAKGRERVSHLDYEHRRAVLIELNRNPKYKDRLKEGGIL